jgi:hypothetical protein
MFSTPFILLSLVSSTLATVFITSPVASTTFNAGQQATISWQDSGSAPSLKDFGASKISVYVGNAQQQTQLQEIVPSVDVSTTSSVQFTPDATIGPNGNEDFIRFESLNLKDTAAPQFPALAFSAKFTMAGMTGQFSAAVQAQIDGQSTAPIAGQTSAAPAGQTSGGGVATVTKSASGSSSKASGSATKTGALASSSSKAANSGLTFTTWNHNAWIGVLVGVIAGAVIV